MHDLTAGSAAHTHISVHPLDGITRTGDTSTALAPTLSSHSRSFLQALLSHLPSICAFTLPTRFSYARMLDGIWSGGTWVGWGIEAREAPIRVTGPNAPPTHINGLGGGQHFEFRCVDGTSNPYLVLAALLGVGARGICENAKLKVKGVDMADVEKTIAEMSEVERKRNGIEGVRLPLTLQEARTRLGQDEIVRNLVGSEFVDKYLSVNEV